MVDRAARTGLQQSTAAQQDLEVLLEGHIRQCLQLKPSEDAERSALEAFEGLLDEKRIRTILERIKDTEGEWKYADTHRMIAAMQTESDCFWPKVAEKVSPKLFSLSASLNGFDARAAVSIRDSQMASSVAQEEMGRVSTLKYARNNGRTSDRQ